MHKIFANTQKLLGQKTVWIPMSVLGDIYILATIFLVTGSRVEHAYPNRLQGIGTVATVLMGLVTASITLVNVRMTVYTSSKNSYINSVTSARIKYIDALKKMVADYCGMIKAFTLRPSAPPTTAPSVNDLLFEKLDSLRFQICFQLNYRDRFDQLFMINLQKIADLAQQNNNAAMNLQDAELAYITTLTQALVKCEWEGIKLESEHGIRPKDRKDQLWKDYLGEHVEVFDLQNPGKLIKFPGFN